jgi:hypothetical protein
MKNRQNEKKYSKNGHVCVYMEVSMGAQNGQANTKWYRGVLGVAPKKYWPTDVWQWFDPGLEKYSLILV